MRLSETSQPRRERLELPARRLAEQEQKKARKTRMWKTGLSLGLLAVLAAAVVGAVSLGRHLTTQASGGMNNCSLMVPANALTAQGLATPFQLAGPVGTDMKCHEANPAQSAFVQGAIFDPATGQISIYNPLVIDAGTQPAAAPVVPQLPANAIVALWIGFNGMNLKLTGATLAAHCVNGLGDSLFGQDSYCNAPAFFQAANQAIQAGKITPPPLGTAKDGLPCPSVRDFAVVDQDQSDNVTTTYLVTQNGQTAQNTAANAAALAGAQPEANGSDNRLLDAGLDAALGCTPWMAPDLADNGNMVPALPLNELQAAMYQQAPIATVPSGDPMTLVNNVPNLVKLNLYRAGVDQAAVQQGGASTTTYCKNLLQIAPARMQMDMPLTSGQASLDAGAANSLFTFLAQRFNFTWGPDGLNCAGLLKQQSPITLQQDANGVTTGATITLNSSNSGTTGTPTPTPGGSGDNSGTPATPTPTPGGNTGNTGSVPSCVINGMTVPGCAGTTTLNGQTCTFAFDANTKQVTITCK